MRPRAFALDAVFWRRLAKLGSTRGPEWWVRYSPAFFGWTAALVLPSARRAVLANLRQIRGNAGPLRDTLDVARTFGTYAGCLAEVLATGSKNARVPPVATHEGMENLDSVLAAGAGAIFVTAHTAGWEVVGPLLARAKSVELIMVMQPERDAAAREIHDQARLVPGVRILHVGDDPFASLPLLRHLQKGGLVALQIDRVMPGMKTRDVALFDGRGVIPEGPIRLAQLSGAPIVPVFSARSGYRRYEVRVDAPIRVARRATDADLDFAAQAIADDMTRFLRAHPAHWFRFQPA